MNRLNTTLSIALICTLIAACSTKKKLAQEEEAIVNTDIAVPDSPPEVFVEENENPVYMVVEEMPEYPGGSEAMFRFLKDSMRYPKSALENRIQGTVVVSFVIDTSGRVTEAKVIKEIGWGCGDEALRLVKLMPRWKPGKQRGKAVRVRYNLPIHFKLN